MKTIAILGLLSLCFVMHGQTTTGAPNVPVSTQWVGAHRDADSTTFERTSYERAPDGSIMPHIHKYVQIESGLNRRINGQYVPSNDRIEISADGTSAYGTNCQHQACFPGNLMDGIKVLTPDGKVIQSLPIGLTYSDGSHSVLLATATNSSGAILPSGNQVIYKNAFNGLKADIIFCYTKNGVEQDVVLRQQPPDPPPGLNPAKTRLQMITEFVASPSPSITAATVHTAAGRLENDRLSFGRMAMGGRGKAFLIGAKTPSARIEKHWLKLNGRQFLIEEIPIVSVAKAIDSLPRFSSMEGKRTTIALAKDIVIPPQLLAGKSPKAPFLAKAAPPECGLVLDYQLLNNSSLSQYTFQSNLTYYVSGYCEIDELTVQGGAVVKFARHSCLMVDDVYCQTGPANMATFTAVDDDSIGEVLPNSTGQPQGYYADTVLDFYSIFGDNPAGELSKLNYLRLCYAEWAILNPESDIGFVLDNSQIIQCDYGVVSMGQKGDFEANFLVRNVLVDRIGSAVFYGESYRGTIENMTVSGVSGGSSKLGRAEYDDEYSDYSLQLINCLGESIDWGITYDTGEHVALAGTDCFTNIYASTFQSAGSGNYYLNDYSSLHGQGTPNVDGINQQYGAPALLPQLRSKTTYAPRALNDYIYDDITLYPRVPRDTSGSSVDPGYHYDALDYWVESLNIAGGATFTLAKGVTIGVSNNNLTVNGTLVASAQSYPMTVQEQPSAPITMLVGTSPAQAVADCDHDGLPDWWEAAYFGVTGTQNAATMDTDGNNLLSDYLNGTEPANVITFSITVTNNYVNTYSVPAQLTVRGIPRFIAISIDDTNFAADASWTFYASSNITVNLGSTQGWHDIWIGLRSYTDDATAGIWQWKRLKLDTLPPELMITSPTNATVDKAIIQLVGYSPEGLQSISYDLTNAAGVATNQQVLVLDRHFDQDSWEFTTNTFQAFDVPLASGANTITLHATDEAGNLAATNFVVTLDYSTATNPTIRLTWPEDGMKICGDDFTIRGWTEDESATVSAMITDTNGDTNVVTGEVGRDGTLWAKHLPLHTGTNWLTVSVTNSAGLWTETHLAVVKSTMTFTLTHIDGDLWHSTVNVSGVISDPNAPVYVNGVQGTNHHDGTWSATGVPVTPGGVASFDYSTTPPGQQDDGGNVNAEKPPELYVESYESSETNDQNGGTATFYTAQGDTSGWAQWNLHHSSTLGWANGSGGMYVATGSWDGTESNTTSSSGSQWGTTVYEWPATEWPSLTNGSGWYFDTNIPTGGSPYGISTTNLVVGTPSFTRESCNVVGQYDFSKDSFTYPDGSRDVYGGNEIYHRRGQEVWKLRAGGRTGVSRQNLFCFGASATAWRLLTQEELGVDTQLGDTTNLGPVGTTRISIGSLGHLGGDGTLWVRLWDNSPPIDVTPQIQGVDAYTFSEPGFAKYRPYIQLTTATTNADLETTTPEVCVGQKVNFTLNWRGWAWNSQYQRCDTFQGAPNAVVTAGEWTLPEKYVNEPWQETMEVTDPGSGLVYEVPYGSVNYRINANLLENTNQTSCWYVNKPGGHVLAWLGLTLDNGQYVSIAAKGDFTVRRPQADIDTNSVSIGPVQVEPSGQTFPAAELTSGDVLFNAKVMSETFSGQANWRQLINRTTSGDGLQFLQNLLLYNSYGLCLDNDPFYNTQGGLTGTPPDSVSVQAGISTIVPFGSQGFGDRPSVGIASTSYLRLADSFNTYLVFNPDPNNSDNIWVILGRVNWGWNGYTAFDLSSDKWILVSGTTNAPTFTATDDFPVWTKVYHNSK